uniref:Uncharacterized protein n=1 Tax=Octopus bimaculoides TaxID=37653 RepID=A0A0L8FFH5_OCTBM
MRCGLILDVEDIFPPLIMQLLFVAIFSWSSFGNELPNSALLLFNLTGWLSGQTSFSLFGVLHSNLLFTYTFLSSATSHKHLLVFSFFE